MTDQSGIVTIHNRYTFHVSHSRDCINEEFFFQDIRALSTVIVRQCGYTAVVNVKGETKKGMADLRDIVIDDLPDGGANSLNLNRYVHPSRFLSLYIFYHIVHVRIPFSISLLASLLPSLVEY